MVYLKFKIILAVVFFYFFSSKFFILNIFFLYVFVFGVPMRNKLVTFILCAQSKITIEHLHTLCIDVL